MANTVYCEECCRLVEYSTTTEAQDVTVRGVEVTVPQMVAHCAICGKEVYPNELIDFNVRQAHDAYRDSVGSIRSGRILELLERYDIGSEPLSRLLVWGPNTIARQIKHTVPDREHAKRLESLFDVREMELLILENGHLISKVAREKVLRKIQGIKGARPSSTKGVSPEDMQILKDIPYRDIRLNLHAMPDTRVHYERRNALLGFFGVDKLADILNSPAAKSYLAGYRFRMSQTASENINVFGLTAWLRAGELGAEKIQCPDYDATKLQAALPQIRQFTRLEDITEAWEKTITLMRMCGVKVIAIPYMPKTRVNGAVKWIDGNPVITLNARGACVDVFWFTLLHEIGHILKHGDQYADIRFDEKNAPDRAVPDAREAEADDFARQTLIPDHEFCRLKETLEFIGVSDTTINVFREIIGRFSTQVDIGADIVIGRLAHEDVFGWDHPICTSRRRIRIV